MRRYDLIVIGGGPAGVAAALEAAGLGRRVALVGRAESGAPMLLSKLARAAVLAGAREDLLWRGARVAEREQDATAERLRRAKVDVIVGGASFTGPHTVAAGVVRVEADRFVIAAGTVPVPGVLDPERFLRLGETPRRLTIVGAGGSGLELASLAAALGTRVTLVERRDRILAPADPDVAEALAYHLRGLGVTLRLGHHAERVSGGAVRLRGGERIEADAVVWAAGRRGATAGLNLNAVGVAPDRRGRIAMRTRAPHVFAAGDVTGCALRAAGAVEQGRMAARAALGEPVMPVLVPYALHTIPELAFVGRGERPRDVRGVAQFRELTRGAIDGAGAGLLKLLTNAATRRIEGVHVFGTGATELIHIGQAAIATGMTVDGLAGMAFGVPAFAEAYRVAARDAVARLAGRREVAA